jgi:calcium/calmodulin-dependent protein kinase I
MFDSCGTPAYVAPEVLRKAGYSKEVDIWSTGVILYTMLSRSLPFHSSDRKQTFKLIKEADPDLETGYWETASKEVTHLIHKMLEKEPTDRITVDDALRHPFFAKYKISPSFMNGES